ncbi:MAG: GNAT family N-acetyltransferase [Anaerolineae bacterium]|jgi:GNAT superfamily N-acetyltransferase
MRTKTEKLTMRRYRNEEDYWRIRSFLRHVFLLNDHRQYSWPVGRLDYWRWHGVANCGGCGPIESVIFIWETEDGEIAAVLNPEGHGEAFLQVDPLLRTPELEEEMLDVAEQHLVHPRRRRLWAWAHSNDNLRQEILTRRGFSKVGQAQVVEYQHRRWLDGPIPEVQVAPGYIVRSLGEIDELPSRSWASWRAFHPDAPDEDYEGWEWYHGIQRQPLYRRDLDIVAVAPDGEIAAFCTIWYDDVTRSAMCEPVGTVPEHQRRGLARAILTEGLHRVKRMGAVMAFVSGFSPAANALYDSVFSPDCDLSEPWIKQF